jgi:hypothetical protein
MGGRPTKWVLAAADLKNHFATTPRHARLSDTLQNRALESMNCKTCDDLLGAYQRAVHLYTTTVVNTAGLFGANRRLASQEAERLKLACRDADNALISHLHQDHGNPT